MAPVIWGLPLDEMKWAKFKSSYMWNNVYHLRRTKFIVYQCALILCVFSESLATAVLSDYIDQQDAIKNMNGRAVLHNNDYVGAGSFDIWSGVFCAFVFGAAFFFDLFWPERHEIPGVRLAWKICGVLAVVFLTVDALVLTVITATRQAYISGVSSTEASRLEAAAHKSPANPFVYRHNARALASVVFVWLGWASTIGSCILLFFSIRHDDKYGPFSSHERRARQIPDEVDRENKEGDRTDSELGTTGINGHHEKNEDVIPNNNAVAGQGIDSHHQPQHEVAAS